MRKHRPSVLCWTLAGLLGAIGTVSADAAVSYSYEAGTPAFSNSGITVGLYLREHLTNGSPSLLVGQNGLFSAGLSIAATPSGATAPHITGITTDPGFGGLSLPSFNATSAALVESVEFTTASAGPMGTVVAGDRWVPLGSLILSMGDNGTSVALTLSRHDAGGGNTLTFNTGLDLDLTDNGSAGGASYTGAADGSLMVVFTQSVPEPGTLAMVGMGVLALAWRRGR